MTSELGPRSRFRELIRQGAVVAPGVYDALSARVVERAGYKAAMISGAAVSAALYALPDLGFVGFETMVSATRRIVGAVTIPVVADCDTGYGGTLNVRQTVREMEVAGVAGLFIEDQEAPKRCGHFAGKSLVSTAEMTGKILAAVEARTDPNLVLIARSDAIAVEGLEGTLERIQAYAQAGADMIFVDAPTTREELEAVAAYSTVPTMVNLVEGGKTPLLPASELEAMGFSFITYSGTLQKAAIKVMEEVLASIAESGGLESIYPSRVVSLDHRSDVLGLQTLLELDNQISARSAGVVSGLAAENKR